MKIIIAGAGEVGTYLANMLSNENHDIVVIDTDEEQLKGIGSKMDLLTVYGSATSISVLKETDIKNADLFIAVTHIEEVNITAAILGKKLGAAKTIARIDNEEYLHPYNKEYFTALGIDYMIYPEKIAAKEVVGLLHKAGTSDSMDFSKGKLSLFVIRLDENAKVIGKSLNDFTSRREKMDYRIVAITRKGETIIPRGDDVLMNNDVIYVITNRAGIDDLLDSSGKEQHDMDNIMIVGGSRIGIEIARGLGAHHNIKLIESKREKSYRISHELNNSLVINGDGTDMSLLKEEKISNMDAFIAVTRNSETNILACLHAKRVGVKKTVAEVENFDYIELAESLGIEVIINKKISAASRIFRFTMSTEVSSLKCLRGTNAEVMEFLVKPGSKSTRDTIKDIKFPKNSIIGGIVRGSSSFIAKGDTRIKPNDKVVVFALPSAIKDVGKFFRNNGS